MQELHLSSNQRFTGTDGSLRARLVSRMGVGVEGYFHEGLGKCVVFSCGCV